MMIISLFIHAEMKRELNVMHMLCFLYSSIKTAEALTVQPNYEITLLLDF